MLPILKRPKVYLTIIAALVLIVFIANGKKTETPDFVEARRADIVQEVQVTGTVKSSEKVDLSFERSARVYKNYVKVGDTVRAGQILAIQHQGAQAGDYQAAAARVQMAQATVSQYEAGVAAAQAKLDELLKGARPEELGLKDADVMKARATLTSYISDYAAAQSQAFSAADAGVRVTLAPLFGGTLKAGYTLNFNTCDIQAKTDAVRLRTDIENMLMVWIQERGAMSGTVSLIELQSAHARTLTNLNHVKSLTDVLSRTVHACNENDPTVITYQSYVNTVRDVINTQTAAITSARVTAENQEVQVKRVQEDRDLSAKSARDEQISSQTSNIASAKAQLNAQKASLLQAYAQLRSSGSVLGQGVIRAPIAGMVTRNDLKEGEVVNGFTPVITVQDTNFELEAFIPETDIAKIKKDLKARVTLDAYGSEVNFLAHVAFIDPAETKVEGVSTYKVKIQFDSRDERVRSGMTASVYIETARRTNVVAVPERAVVVENGSRIVRVLHEENTITETTVEVGLRGSAGLIEITKGVDAGVKLVTGVVVK